MQMKNTQGVMLPQSLVSLCAPANGLAIDRRGDHGVVLQARGV
jgi:hypothetical protein